MHLFQKYLIQFTLSHFTEKPHHIYYYGDVAALQYKNKFNFLNLCNHANNVGITEMVFFATSHGKSACDGVGGTIK